VLERPADGEVVGDEAVGAVGAQHNVLVQRERARLGRVRLVVGGAVDDHVGGRDAAALDLEVAAHAGSLVRDALAARERRARGRGVRHLTALDVDEVLVVGAGDLVAVARGLRAARVLLRQVGAARVVERLRARGRLGVDAGHDHDAVVVVRVEHGRLDLVVLALLGELGVLPVELLRLALVQPQLRLAGPQLVPVPERLVDRLGEQVQRLAAVPALAHDAHVAGPAARDRRPERTDLGHLSAGGGLDGRVRCRVRPVGRALQVGDRDGGQNECAEDGAEQDPPHGCGR
jgi:hypothetical protein